MTTQAVASDDPIVIAGRSYQSRLLVGTGRYRDLDQARESIIASQADIVTVAIRRLSTAAEGSELLPMLESLGVTVLPNTAGCFSVEDAVYTCQLARDLLEGQALCKLEVFADDSLYPDVRATVAAAEALVADGFEVMAYTSDDPLIARELEAIGCVAVMPLAAPIGSGLGICNPAAIRRIVESLKVPVLVDAGVGTASDAALAMELGCDAVLLNTAIAYAGNPPLMASAMRHAIIAGRQAALSGRMPKRELGMPSSPTQGTVG